jgi:hypothetical protein
MPLGAYAGDPDSAALGAVVVNHKIIDDVGSRDNSITRFGKLKVCRIPCYIEIEPAKVVDIPHHNGQVYNLPGGAGPLCRLH